MAIYNYSFSHRLKGQKRLLTARLLMARKPLTLLSKTFILLIVPTLIYFSTADIYAKKIPERPKVADFDSEFGKPFMIASASEENFDVDNFLREIDNEGGNKEKLAIAGPDEIDSEIVVVPQKKARAGRTRTVTNDAPSPEFQKINESITAVTKKRPVQPVVIDRARNNSPFIPEPTASPATLAPGATATATGKPENLYDKPGPDTAAVDDTTANPTEIQPNSDTSAKLEVKIDENYQYVAKVQQEAKDALMAEMNEVAIELYKKSLEMSPNNKDSMVGLAIAYHRNNQYIQARQLYSEILAKEPGNKEVLSNYLVLISQQSPSEALTEFDKLYKNNPGFSMLPAQMGMVFLRQGNFELATKYLFKAVTMSPDNLLYKYNLAIAFDNLGNKQEAARFYQEIISADGRGVAIPDSAEKIQERLNFILTN